MKALLVGASGTIGSAVNKLLEDKGVEVIRASRSSNPPLNMMDNSSITHFYASLGQVDAIVITAGDAGFNKLDELTEDDIQISVNSKLLGQINMVRKGLKNLAPGGVFVITGGVLAYSPLPKTSMIAMVNAALEGFARAVALELTENRRIVVVHPDWVAETAEKLGMDTSNLPDAKKTATAYWEAINSKVNGKPVFVEGHEPLSKIKK